MQYPRMIWLAVASLQLAACASNPQLPVSFGDNALAAQSGRVGVAMTALPKVDTSFPGAGCLLCLATAATANSSLTRHTHMLTGDEFLTIKDGIADRLRKKGVDAVVITENLNIKQLKDFSGGGVKIAKKDFRPLKDQYKVDHLVLIDITRLGFVRNYAVPAPAAQPAASVTG